MTMNPMTNHIKNYITVWILKFNRRNLKLWRKKKKLKLKLWKTKKYPPAKFQFNKNKFYKDSTVKTCQWTKILKNK